MSVRANLRLPKEHGAWAMLYVPFVMGVMVAGSVSWRLLLLLLSVTFIFIARESLLAWWRSHRRHQNTVEARRMLIVYLCLAALFGSPLVLVYQLWVLAFLGPPVLLLLAANAEQAVKQEDRTVLGETLAIIGLTMTAPAAYYVARGQWEATAWWLWWLNILYFTSSVFYIKLRVLTLHARIEQARRQVRQRCAFYHSFLVLALFLLAFTGSLNLFAVVAFTPVILRAFWHLLRPSSHLNLQRVGVWEICYSIVFLILTALAFSRT